MAQGEALEGVQEAAQAAVAPEEGQLEGEALAAAERAGAAPEGAGLGRVPEAPAEAELRPPSS